jgi:predicted ATPase
VIRVIFLGDFQGFMDTKAELAPLTLVFGPNGAGKSSIGRALKLMKQSSSNEVTTPGFVFKGSEIEFGSSKDAIRGQLKSRDLPAELSLGLRLSLQDSSIPAYMYQEDPRSTRSKVSFQVALPNEQGTLSGAVSTDGKRFSADACFNLKADGVQDLTQELDEELLSAGKYMQIRGNLLHFTLPEDFPGSWDELFDTDSEILSWFYCSLNTAVKAFQEALAVTTFIEPLRPIPSKLQLVNYTKASGAEARELDRTTERQLANLMLRLTDERYELIVKNVPLPDLDVNVQAKFVVDSHTGAELGFDQVGTGISQVAPLVDDLVLGRGTTYIEQPELHLHPRMQSLLMTEYIEAVQRDPSRQFIIETHSETMLLRVQKRIREGSLDPELVSILFVNKAELDDGTKFNSIEKLNLDELGDFLDPLPVSFMDIRMQDLL